MRLLNKDGSVKSWIPAKARGYIAAGAFPDKGFGMGRPDLRLHGVRALA